MPMPNFSNDIGASTKMSQTLKVVESDPEI